MDFRIDLVKALLDKLSSRELVDNFRSIKLDVSLLTKMTKTLLWVSIVLDDASVADGVKDVLGYAVFEVHNLFHEFKTKVLHCKVDAEFRRVINSKLQKLIEKFKGLSSGEQVGELRVFNTDWNQTPVKSVNSFYVFSTSVKLLLLDKLVSNEFVDKFQGTELDVSLLEKLKSTLLKVEAIVKYVEMKQITTNITVNMTLLLDIDGIGERDRVLWLDKVESTVIEVYNLFDEINHGALHFKVEQENSNLYSPFELFNRAMNSKIQKLIRRLEFSFLQLGVLVDKSSQQLISLSTFLKELLDQIVSSEFVDNFRSTKLDISLLEKLEITLSRVLSDVYVKTTLLDLHDAREIVAAGLWLDMLRNAVFEVGYLFDNPLILRCNVEAEYQPLMPSSQVLTNISSPFKWFNGVTNSKLQKLIQRLEFCSSRVQGQFGGSSSKSVWRQTPTISLLDDESSSIYGRDNDINKLKHLLLSSDGDDCKIGIISIVGIEGIGKTTLAKFLYNDPEVYDKFELKVWAHVSKDFDDLSVLETSLDNLNTNTDDTSDVNNIYPNFLLVLDEVSDARSINWTLLMHISNLGERGSRIIITTQDERVALSIQTFRLSMQTFLSVHYLRPLESEDCWTLLAGHAFGAFNDQQRSNLEGIGRGIANKCYGSPFAAVALGDILFTKLSLDYWNYVLENDILLLLDHDVRPFIQLSYHYLPTPLKRCFEYCSIFPKNSIIEKNLTVELWIAEGLVESSTNQEKVGEEYFDVLVSRSLIHRRSIGNDEVNFEMHYLAHDLATEGYMDEHNLHDRVHKFSYNRGIYDSYNKFDKLYGLKDHRTFLALPLQKQLPLSLLSNKVVHDLLPTMKQLRVLSLSNYKSITEVPNSIGNLLYLRYLNLSYTKIDRLPSETCKLYNLQFLLLAGCKRLTELPEDMGKLVNLRHLDVSDTALREMPVQIAKLENLQSLSSFVVSKHTGGSNVGELGKHPDLHGKLSISQLQNVNDPLEAVQANMKMKDRIDKLSLEWDCCITFSDSKIQSVVLEHLQPSTNLKSLTIKGYGGISFPNWLGDSLFSNMVYLRISNCDDCLWLPPLGQLGNLKKLIIEEMQSVQTIGTEFYGSDSSPSFQPFRSLETLHFENMQEWEEWNLIEGTNKEFPCLKTLSLIRCPKLRLGDMLDKYPSLTEHELRECPLLVQSMPSSDHAFRQLIMFPLNFLRQLTIDGFPSPMSLAIDGLPKTLRVLIISNCENLEFLPHEYFNNTSLEELKISYSCNSMISFTLGVLPVLNSLFIEGCKNLKSILIEEGASEKSLSFLRSIKIWDCNELESFSPGGLATPNLIYFSVWKCEKLRSLPKEMSTLTGLHEMEIDDLPNLQSFVIDDLPSSLRELTVGSVGGISWNSKPTWERLNCLSLLRIKGGDMVNSFMVSLLPASLVTLCICGLGGKSIDRKWLQHLTSLQNLEIVNAPKLKLWPTKGFPSSLLVLSMTHCPLLEASLRRKQGKEWRKISHIPSIIIDDELIT